MTGIAYSGNHNTTPGFQIPTLLEFVETTRERLKEPLRVPDYAAAGEENSVSAAMQAIRDDPYALRAALAESVKRLDSRFQEGSLRPISYGDYPQLYRAGLFVTAVTKELANTDLLIRLYTAKRPEDRYQAMAASYLDKAWIYISDRFFRELQMVDGGELCFLIGHELGHAHCRHTTIQFLGGGDVGRNGEYSADRSGLIVCAKWLAAQDPELAPEQAARQAVLCGLSMLDKLEVACRGGMDWREYDRQALADRLQGWLDDPNHLPPDGSTHPCNARRALAMYHFSRSRLFYRCAGLPIQGQTLLDDGMLREFMNTLLS